MTRTGEAVYVDDIPSPPNGLHGAFIYSTKPLAGVEGIQLESNQLTDGVTVVITFKDIPSRGANIGATTSFGSVPLFADDLARSTGDRIVVVGNSVSTTKYAIIIFLPKRLFEQVMKDEFFLPDLFISSTNPDGVCYIEVVLGLHQ